MPRKALQLNLTTGTIVQTPDLVESSEVATVATANGIPRANVDGKIAVDWLPVGWERIEGITARYWTNTSMSGVASIERTETTIDFQSSPPGVPGTNYSARYEGWIIPNYSETYTLILGSDDGSRLYVNGELRINAWFNQPYTERSTTVTATAQQAIHIVIDWYQASGDAVCRFFWESPSQSREIVPASAWRTDRYRARGWASGDLAEWYPDPKVVKIQTRPVAETAPTTGQALVWDGTAWTPTTVSVNDGNKGDLTVSGSTWTINPEAVTYNKIQPVSANRLLGRSNTNGPVQEISLGAGLTLNGTTLQGGDATQLQGRPIATTAPTTGQALVWNGTAWTPVTVGEGGAGDAVSLQGRPVSNTAPTTGQVLTWNGTVWLPQTVSSGGGGDTSPGSLLALFERFW